MSSFINTACHKGSFSYRAEALELAGIQRPGSSTRKQDRCFDVMKSWAMTLFLTSHINWSSVLNFVLFSRESTGWAAKQADRGLPGFPLQTAGASVWSLKSCSCIKETQNNDNRLLWLLDVHAALPFFPQNGIQSSLEWGSALSYPQLARLQGNLNVYMWIKCYKTT